MVGHFNPKRSKSEFFRAEIYNSEINKAQKVWSAKNLNIKNKQLTPTFWIVG